MKDRLEEIFELRESFMRSLSESLPDSSVTWPLDISKKESQQHCRDIALRGVEEMFEALQHLKNWKTHKLTEDPEFDRDEFLEEVVDAFNYFFALLIAVNCDEDEFFDAFLKKDTIIHDRIKNKY